LKKSLGILVTQAMRGNFMKKTLLLILLLSTGSICYGSTLYQVSTGNALIAGLYQGAVDFKTLKREGNFGIGSVKGMNGELIAIDGKFYRIAPDGKMNLISPEETTPFALVTHFKSKYSFKINKVSSLKDLVTELNKHIDNRNIPYAIHIQGKFDSLSLRAVKGSKPPYPPFKDLVQKQAIFNLTQVNGDGVGFFYLPYLNRLNVPGYHIHFITSDRKTGGHILKIAAEGLQVELMPMDNLLVRFPSTPEFAKSKKINVDNMPLMKNSFGDGIQEN
jgi:acetolactate decarboxylase